MECIYSSLCSQLGTNITISHKHGLSRIVTTQHASYGGSDARSSFTGSPVDQHFFKGVQQWLPACNSLLLASRPCDGSGHSGISQNPWVLYVTLAHQPSTASRLVINTSKICFVAAKNLSMFCGHFKIKHPTACKMHAQSPQWRCKTGFNSPSPSFLRVCVNILLSGQWYSIVCMV